MNPKFLINPIDETGELAELVSTLGLEYKTSEYRPLDTSLPLPFGGDDFVMFHGSLEEAKRLRRETNWSIYCDLPKFECTTYYSKYYKYLLNTPYIMLPYGDLNHQKRFLMRTLSSDLCLFMRPNTGDKRFTGQIVDERNWDKTIQNLGFEDISPDELIVVAEPQNLLAEWRLWIGDGKVIGYSMYKPLKLATCPQDVIWFAEMIAKVWTPERLFVMDIAQVQDGYKLIEINSFGCSGFYKVDLSTMIPKAIEVARKEYLETL